MMVRNYPTNDWMVWYKQGKEYFFTDKFFVTNKTDKSLQGHLCYQLFATDKIDKVFLHVVPLRSKGKIV